MCAEKLLFSLLRIAVCQWAGDETVYTACTSDALERAYALAVKYDLAHLLGIALKKLGLGNLPMAQNAEKLQMVATYRYVQLSHEQEQVTKTLEEGEIPFIPLKGAVLRDYYPESWMRTSCDVDVLVHEEDLESAVQLLQTRLQYTFKEKTAHDVTLVSPGGVHLELHYTVLEKTELAMLPRVMESIWEESCPVPGKQYHMMLSDAMFYCYHIAHIAKHFEIGGCGVRPLLDTWILCHKVEFDRQLREELLQKGGILAFANAAEKLSEVWFSGVLADSVSKQMESYIFHGGLYGGVENRIAISHVQNKKGMAYVLSRLFLPYDSMKIQFPILEKQKWLLPFCYVLRWGKRLFDGGLRRGSKELKVNATLLEERVLTTKELLEYLGLRS